MLSAEALHRRGSLWLAVLQRDRCKRGGRRNKGKIIYKQAVKKYIHTTGPIKNVISSSLTLVIFYTKRYCSTPIVRVVGWSRDLDPKVPPAIIEIDDIEEF